MLHWISWSSLALAVASALFIAVDEMRHPQKMSVMNAVWPVTALYLSVAAVWWYLRAGRGMAKDASAMKMPPRADKHTAAEGQARSGGPAKFPGFQQSALAASHCGAGCALADIATEFALFAVGATIAGSALLASYLYDFAAAWALGIVFQYFSIKPMRHLSAAAGVIAAIKADTLSILAFQVGMYAWMALVHYRFFPGPHLHPDQAAYWLMMQVGMICGLLTAMPMNAWLVARGWKESMG